MKNNLFFYNLKGIARMLTPPFLLPKNREKILRDLDSRKDLDYIKNRVDYYCQMNEKTALDESAKSLDFLRWTHKRTAYFFDCYEYARYFPQRFKAHFEFGDVNYIPQKPSLAKSRPILEYYEQTLSSHCEGAKQTNQSATKSSLRDFCKKSKQSTNPKIDCHDFATQNLAMTRWDALNRHCEEATRPKQSKPSPSLRDFGVDCHALPDGKSRNDDSPASSLRESQSDSWQSTKNTNGGGQNDLNGADSSNSPIDSPQNPPFSNATLLNMNKIRHFIFINDTHTFESKQDKLFYRGGIYRGNRIDFFEKYFNNPLCDLGHTGSKSIHHAWQKPKIGIAKHLPYKFLLSLEGNDVASNLKWVMSSNSLCVAPKMKFETWFMEGRLKGGVHFVEIRDDYSDLEEKLEHFIAHPKDALEIIHNAHEYIAQFRDKKREDIISLLVLEKYFYYTGQIDSLRI